MFDVTLDDSDFNYVYHTLGSDRSLYGVWIHDNTVWSTNPYTDLIAPNDSTPFIPPIWCLNNYTIPRFFKEIQMAASLTDMHIKEQFRHTSDNTDIYKSIHSISNDIEVLLDVGVETLWEYEQLLLLKLYDFLNNTIDDQPFMSLSLSDVFDLYQSLTIVSGSHDSVLRFLVCYHTRTYTTHTVTYEQYGQVLLQLQLAERFYFQSIQHYRSDSKINFMFKKYRNVFNGENDILTHPDFDRSLSSPDQQRAIPYLFPLLYSGEKQSPQSANIVPPFVAFHRPDPFPALTELRNTTISNACTPAFRNMLKQLKITPVDQITNTNRTCIEFTLECLKSANTICVDTSTESLMCTLTQLIQTWKSTITIANIKHEI
jgi:hypothetical protein